VSNPNRDRLVRRLAELVATPSENPPGNEAACGELVARHLDEAGLEVEIHEAEPGRPNIVARLRGEPGPTLTYCSHIDVVPAGDPSLWSYEPFGAVVADNMMYGRGTSDAKGPVMAAIEAATSLAESGWRPRGTLELALVADEETMGFKGTGYLVEKNILNPDVAIVGEPTSLRVVRAQRGAYWIRLITRGLAAHGSAPERGRNAILHMAEILQHLPEAVPDMTHELLGGPTIGVGTIRGGEKVNVVAASCVAEIDRRTIPGETRESVIEGLQRAIDRAKGRFSDIDAQIELAFAGEPFEVGPDAAIVREVSGALSEVTGQDPQVIGFRGASDARFLAEAGADVVVWGPGDIGLAHTAREAIDLTELELGAAAYALAFQRLLGPPPD